MVFISVFLSACGEGGSYTVTITSNYTIGGTVSGLTATGLVLQNNGADSLTVDADGAFIFSSKQDTGTNYNVTVTSQPADQICTVNNGSGTVASASITNIVVNCASGAYMIGGTVTGLQGSGLELINSNGETLAVSVEGAYAFTQVLADGSDYSVSVNTQPTNPAQTCVVNNGTGTIAGSPVGNIDVICGDPVFTVSGSVTGLVGSGLQIQNNGGDTLAITADGVFSFPASLADGAQYNVTLLAQPFTPAQTCEIVNGTGSIAGASISDVAISCTIDAFTVSGTVTGMTGTGLQLQINGGELLNISGNGPFSFTTNLADLSAFSVTVISQPASPAQECVVTNGSGSLTGANIINVEVACNTSMFTIGGNVSGLAGTGLQIQINGGELLNVGANGAFTFNTTLADLSAYTVTVASQPGTPAQTCLVSNGSGNVSAANVESVAVNCTTVTYTIGGTVANLAGSGLQLQLNGGEILDVSANGAFTFPTALADATGYTVTVLTQPVGRAQECTVTNGTGTLSGQNVSNISVDCVNVVSLVPPADIQIAVTGTTINLSWTNPGVEGFRIYTNNTGTVSEADTLVYEGTATAFSHRNVNARLVYYYVIQSYVGVDNSTLSTIVQAQGVGYPSGPTLESGDGFVTLSYQADGATGYRVYWNTTGAVSEADSQLDVGQNRVFGHQGLSNGTTYYYKVAPYNAYGNGTISREYSATPSVGLTPSAQHVITEKFNDAIKSAGRIIAVGDTGNIVISDDNGVSWARVQSGTISDLSDIHLTISGRLFVAAMNRGLLASDDNGNTWQFDAASTPNKGVAKIVEMPSGALRAAGGSDSPMYESLDGGLTWSLLYPGQFIRGALLAVNDSGMMLNGTVFGSDFRRWDETGQTWISLAGTTADTVRDILWFPPLSRFVAAGNWGTVFSSVDSTTAWTSNRVDINLSQNLNGINMTSSNLLVTAGNYGTLATSANLSTWTMRNSGTVRDLTRVVELEPNSYLAMGSGGALHHSTNLATWSQLDGAPSGYNLSNILVTSAGTYLAFAGPDVLRSSDGSNWAKINTTAYIVDAIQIPNGTIIGVGLRSVWSSSNDGQTWTLLATTSGPSLGQFESIAYGASGYVALIGGLDDGIAVSSNGVTWTAVTGTAIGANGRFLDNIVWDPVSGLYITSGGSTVVYTSPNGTTWTARAVTSGYVGRKIATNNAGVTIIGTSSTGIHRSVNGTVWDQAVTSIQGLSGFIDDVYWTGEYFVAVAMYGDFAYSADGLTWTSITTENKAYTNTIAGSGKTVIIGGDDGILMTYQLP